MVDRRLPLCERGGNCENKMNTLKHLSPSSISILESCPRQWQCNYIEGRRSPQSEFAAIGTAVHAMMESWLKNNIGHPSMHPSLACIPDQSEKESAIKYALSREGKRSKLLGTEIEFMVEVAPGINAKGFIDAVYWHPDGTLEIEDHKTNRTRETTEEWARKIQPRLYSLVARRHLWPTASRIRFTIGYPMIGGDVSWETDPEWDDETLERIKSAWDTMVSGPYEERVGDHCRFCVRNQECGSYREATSGLASSLAPFLGSEDPAQRILNLKSIKKIIESELEKAELEVREIIAEKGVLVSSGLEWTISNKPKRGAPSFLETWRAAMGPEGYDPDAIEELFKVCDELFSVKLGGLDLLMKQHQELYIRLKPIVRSIPTDSIVTSPVEKVVKKGRKQAKT